jgi:S-layer homology domain
MGLALAVAAAVLATAPAASAATRFTDVPADASYAADVQWLVDRGITRGSGPGKFSPTKPVTRQQMAVFLYKARNGSASPPGCRTAPYRDVPKSSAYCGSIAWLKAQGITAGGARFDPTSSVTREAMAVFVHKLGGGGAASACTRKPAPDVAVRSTYCGSIAALAREGIAPVYSDGSFRPSKAATRGATATFLRRWYDVQHRGADVSYPQCRKALPAGQDFGIVGVNGGKPTTVNPCLAQQLGWAAGSSNGTRQAATQVYVNTANPGAVVPRSPNWPLTGTSQPYGPCDGSNSEACAYQYGWNRAAEDVAWVRAVTAPETLVWWLDAEIDESGTTGNTWDRTAGGTRRNTAVLEGMTDHFRWAGIGQVGIYSTGRQWKVITGTAVAADSSLRGLPNWLAGPSTIAEAQRLCSSPPLTPGGRVVLTQWTDVFDWNHECR